MKESEERNAISPEQETVPKESEKQKKQAGKERPKEAYRTLRTVIIAVLAVGIVLAVYIRITNHSRNSSQQAEENMTETEILMQYDLAAQYPKTVREVVKLHCRYLKCLYNEELEDEDFQKLNGQMRELLAEELLLVNDEESQLASLLEDAADFQEAEKIYVSYVVDADDTVQYSSLNGREYATVCATCSIRENGSTSEVQEQYLLVQEDESWKILGWQLLTSSDTEAEEDETASEE